MITCGGNVVLRLLLLLLRLSSGLLLSPGISFRLEHTYTLVDAFNRLTSCLFEVLPAVRVDGVEFEKVLGEHLVQIEVLPILPGVSFEAFNLRWEFKRNYYYI